MLPINFRCKRKSYFPAPNSGGDPAKIGSEVGYNFSKAKFQIHTVRHKRLYLVSLT